MSVRGLAGNSLLGLTRLSFEQLHPAETMSPLAPELAPTRDGMIQKADLKVPVVLAVANGADAHTHGIEGHGIPACCGGIGSHVFGGGCHHALMKLVGRGRHVSTNAQHTTCKVRAGASTELSRSVGQVFERRLVTDAKGSGARRRDARRLAATDIRRSRTRSNGCRGGSE